MGQIRSLGQFIQQNPPLSTASKISGRSAMLTIDKASGAKKMLGLRPSYAPPKPPGRLDLSSPELRAQELSSISDPKTPVRSSKELERIKMAGPSQQLKDCASLIRIMKDDKFNTILKHFSPGLGERFLQAFGKSKGSIDGGRLKKTVLKMVPFINIGAYGRDSMRAQTMKKALSGLADSARRQDNQLALMLSESLGAYQKSKRNSQIIGGVISTVTSALSFVPGASLTSSLSSQLPSFITGRIGNSITSMLGSSSPFTGRQAIESSARLLTSTGVATSSSMSQDHYVTKVSHDGKLIAKDKLGNGYSKLKVATRQMDQMVEMQAEMGFQAARALINYLGPAQGPDEADDSPRMQLRQSLGATDPQKTYTPSSSKPGSDEPSKLEQRKALAKIDPQHEQQDFLQLFFDIGVKGSGFGLDRD